MGAILLAGLAAGLYFLLIPRPVVGAGPQPGQPAPDFALPTPAGDTIRLSDLRGKVVLLNFWATWCPPCRAEVPDLEALQQKYAGRGLIVLGVNLMESDVAIQAFQERTGFTYPTVIDRDGKVFERWRIIPLPTSFFIDRDGIVRWTKGGQLMPPEMEATALGLLGAP